MTYECTRNAIRCSTTQTVSHYHPSDAAQYKHEALAVWATAIEHTAMRLTVQTAPFIDRW